MRTHKAPLPIASLGVLSCEGHPQGVPLPIVFSRRLALRRPQGVPLPICPAAARNRLLGRAPTRGAPTDCLLSAFCPEKGTHKGCPYRLSSLGVLPCEGHPQGVPLPIVFSRRLRRAPTRGAPDCLLSAFGPAKGTHKGCPYRLSSLGAAPTDCPAKGTHKGCPYRLSSLGVWPCEGHPQGVPLPIVFSRRLALRRAPTRGAPTDCLLSRLPCEGHPQGVPLPIVFSRCVLPWKGTHKGCPYRLSSLGVWPCEGHPQGVPLPIVFSRRLALRRAPTRGAPTRFRQPHEVFSNLMQLP